MANKRKCKTYNREFMEEAVKLALDSCSVSKAAKDLGMPAATLHGWVNQSKVDGNRISFGPSSKECEINVTDLLNKNKELQKRISRLEEEKAILKKAATYFAKEIG